MRDDGDGAVHGRPCHAAASIAGFGSSFKIGSAMELCPLCNGGEMRRDGPAVICDVCGHERPLVAEVSVPALLVREADDNGGRGQPLLFPDRLRWARAGRWRTAEREFAVCLADRYGLEPDERTGSRMAAPGRVLSTEPLIHHYTIRGDDWIVHRDAFTRATPWMAYARRDNTVTVLR